MSRALRDINVGIAMMVGVAAGCYTFEPLIREQELKRRAAERELVAISEATREPVADVRRQLDRHRYNAPWTRWLLFRK